MLYSKKEEKQIIYINCSSLQNQLRVDGIYYYNFEVYIYLVWIIDFLVVSVNVLCLITMTNTIKVWRPSDILLKCMVLSDLLMGVFSIPFWLISLLLAYHFQANCTIYRFTVFCCYFVGWLSFLVIFLITLDRYISICKPYFYLKWSSNHRAFKIALLSIFVLSLIGVGSLFLFKTFSLQVIVLCFVIFAILVIDVILYAKIGGKIKSIDSYCGNLVGKQFALNNVTSFEKKGQVINLAMVLALVLSYSPYFFSQVLHFFGVLEDDFGYAVGIWGYALVLVKSFVNPILYCISLKEFRSKLVQQLTFRKINSTWMKSNILLSQPGFTSSKVTIETLNKVWNMFRVNNKGTRTTPCSSVFTVNFEHVIAGWDVLRRIPFCGRLI